MSKGHAPRPFDVPREVYESNHEAIFGERERKPWTPPPQPQDKPGDQPEGEPCQQ